MVDGVRRKDNFWNDGDLVKFFVFEIPYTEDETDHTINMKIEALTEQFHPLILVNQYSFEDKLDDYSTLKFPDMETAEKVYGDAIVNNIGLQEVSWFCLIFSATLRLRRQIRNMATWPSRCTVSSTGSAL